MKAVTEAYDTLSDERRKRTYDFDIHMMGESMGRRRQGSSRTERPDTASEDSFATAFPRHEGESWKEYKQRVVKEFIAEAQAQGYRISPQVIEQWFYEDFSREYKERLRKKYEREGRRDFSQAYAQQSGETESEYKRRIREQFRQDSGMSHEEADAVFSFFSDRMFPYSYKGYFPQREPGESRDAHKRRVGEFMRTHSNFAPGFAEDLDAFDQYWNDPKNTFYDIFWPESQAEYQARWKAMSSEEREAAIREQRRKEQIAREQRAEQEAKERIDREAQARLDALKAAKERAYKKKYGNRPRWSDDPDIEKQYANSIARAERAYDMRYFQQAVPGDDKRWNRIQDKLGLKGSVTAGLAKEVEKAVSDLAFLRAASYQLADGTYLRISSDRKYDRHFINPEETTTVIERITDEKDERGNYRSEGIRIVRDEETGDVWVQRVTRDYKSVYSSLGEYPYFSPVVDDDRPHAYEPIFSKDPVRRGDLTKALNDLMKIRELRGY